MQANFNLIGNGLAGKNYNNNNQSNITSMVQINQLGTNVDAP